MNEIFELEIQKLLRGGNTPADICAQHGLVIKSKPPLCLFDYDDTRCVRNDPVVRECRGLILEVGTWNVVALPFYRFLNHYDPLAAKIDWQTAYAIEKVDGSLITLYHYAGQWHIATRGSVDGDTRLPMPAPGGLQTFKEAVWKILDEKVSDHCNELDKDYCYVFEFVSPWNRVIRVYERPELYLLAVRRTNGHSFMTEYLREVPLSTVRQVMDRFHFGIPSVAQVSSIESAIQVAKHQVELFGPTAEGVVVCDADFRRIKVKTVEYVELSRSANNGKPRYWEFYLKGVPDGFFDTFPSFRREYHAFLDGVDAVFMWASLICHVLRPMYRSGGAKLVAPFVTGHPLEHFIWSMLKDMECGPATVLERMKKDKQRHWLRSVLPGVLRLLYKQQLGIDASLLEDDGSFTDPYDEKFRAAVEAETNRAIHGDDMEDQKQ